MNTSERLTATNGHGQPRHVDSRNVDTAATIVLVAVSSPLLAVPLALAFRVFVWVAGL